MLVFENDTAATCDLQIRERALQFAMDDGEANAIPTMVAARAAVYEKYLRSGAEPEQKPPLKAVG